MLWPLFHYNPSGGVSSSPKQHANWNAYLSTNEAFSRAAVDCFAKLTDGRNGSGDDAAKPLSAYFEPSFPFSAHRNCGNPHRLMLTTDVQSGRMTTTFCLRRI